MKRLSATPGAVSLWPGSTERRLLGRFYLALGLTEALFLIGPFEFAYLFLVMQQPQWAVLPVMAATAAALAIGLPGGLLADRWSRKRMVLCGGIVSGLAMMAVPAVTARAGVGQLLATCGVFAVIGAGDMLIAGASEAWAVDNLHAAGRGDLVDTFFARIRSVTALGAVIAASVALALLLSARASRPLLDLLWAVGGAGMIAGVAFAAAIPERRPLDAAPDAAPLSVQARRALAALVARRALLMMAAAIVLTAVSGTVSDEAFTMSLITKGLDARMLAPLGIMDNLIGIVGPVLGILMLRRMAATRLLALLLILEVAAVSVLFVRHGLAVVLVLYLVLDLLDDVWDPLAIARLQSLTPSSHRATIATLVYQSCTLAELVGLGGFALLLGEHHAALQAATPDLLEAFSGRAATVPPVPAGLWGLPVPDWAIVAFIDFGLLAVPFIVLSGARGAGKRARSVSPGR